MPRILSRKISDFPYGNIDTLESTSIPRGAASRSLNWLTLVDRIVLRGGYKILGNNTTGTGKITGQYVAINKDGDEIPFRTRGKKLEYYNSSADTWDEIGSDILGAGADGKEISFAEYHPVTGDFLYINSPYGPFLKIDLATPSSATDVYNDAKNFYGYIKIKQSRMFLWGRIDDQQGVYLSKVDDVEDFTYSSPRDPGEGAIFRQDDGGGATQNIESYNDHEYCLHLKKTWDLVLTIDDTDATNLIYREKVGIPNWKASVPTANGIYYIDDTDQSDPQIKILTIPYLSALVESLPVSKALKYKNSLVGVDLSGYLFDQSMGWEWGDYIIFACRSSDSDQNNRLLLYNKKQKSIDWCDYFVNMLSNYGGDLIAGDSVSNNVGVLFSGYDDEGSSIDNYWESKDDDLDFEGEKRVKTLRVKGRMSKGQAIEVFVSLDGGAYVSLGTITVDTADYTTSGVIGRQEIGEMQIGGGEEGDEFVDFTTELDFNLGRFNTVRVKFQAEPDNEIGYAEVSEYEYWDIRLKSRRAATI